MNYLVFLDARAGELEKILSGVKSMIVKEFDPAWPDSQLVRPGDSLYFLRNNDECAVRVKAVVVRVLPPSNGSDEDLSHILKELQPRLQLTEDQFNYWSAKQRVLLVEFDSAHKIPELKIAPTKITDRKRWIAFEEIDEVTEEGVNHYETQISDHTSGD
jgi:hypothetical protein